MSEPKYPKGERVWVGYYDNHHELRFILTSKDSRDFYFLYELVDGNFRNWRRGSAYIKGWRNTVDDFTYDCWQKKQLAQQARHRKCGSKSRKCSLPSDSLTKKQWKERNGKTLSINLNQPTSWEVFKEVSKPTQEEYLNHLLAVYGANATSLAAMFHVQPLTIRRFIQANGLAVKFPGWAFHECRAARSVGWFFEGRGKACANSF